MTTLAGPGLLRAVCERPDDDAVRLIYADWLEERGEADRADFIRCHCLHEAWARLPGETVKWQGRQVTGGEAGAALARTHSLWLELKDAVAVSLPDVVVDWAACLYDPGKLENTAVALMDRGMIGSVYLPTADLFTEDVARQLFAAQPVTEVVLADRVPGRGNTAWSWYKRSKNTWTDGGLHPDEPDDIADEIWDLLEGYRKGTNPQSGFRWYDSEQAANAALSAACVTYGRRLAGLPVLGREDVR